MPKKTKNWWFKFNFKDWRTDGDLRRCSLETRGFWVECVCAMHEADAFKLEGSYEELGWLIGCSPEVVARCVLELKRTNAANVTLGNGNVTLVSRRIKRELNVKKQTRLRVRKHRSNKPVTLQSNKKEVISKNKEKKVAANAADPRKDHAAIQAVRSVTNRYPNKELWDSIIETLGDNPDIDLLKRCRIAWVAKGFNPENLAWLSDWYTAGGPPQLDTNKNNGTNSKYITRKSNIDALEDSADYFDQKYGRAAADADVIEGRGAGDFHVN